MYTDLSHLKAEEIEKLMERYYNGEPVKKLVEECGLKNGSKLYTFFPPEEFPNYQCEYCGTVLVADRQSKSMAGWPRHEDSLYCPSCGHKQYRNCNCDRCEALAVKKYEERQKNIRECYGKPEGQARFDELSFTEKIYLGALCRAYLRENLFEIAPIEEKDYIVLAPSGKLRYVIYSSLLRAEAIKISPSSPAEAFTFDDNNWPADYDADKVAYNLNLAVPPDRQKLVYLILNPTYCGEDNQEEALELWRRIALAECLQYLQHNLNKVQFDFSPGEKTYTTFNILLEDYSVSQVFSIIWKAIADASKYYLERTISKKQAANSVIGNCERYAERAKINNWALPKYRRPRELPQSELSLFFFNKVLGIGEGGFNMPPDLSLIAAAKVSSE